MSLFSFKSTGERVGVIVDIGSASVLVALLVSRKSDSHPQILWSHREHAPLQNIESLDQSAKAVMTSLMNALLKFDSEARRALHEYNKHATITELQCSISAPWSYTVTKTINYKQDEPFVITSNLVDELIRTATQKISEELAEHESANELGLAVVTKTTMDMLVNGYRTKQYLGQKTSELSLSHASVIAQNYLLEKIDELHDKLFPETETHRISTILSLYCITQDLYKDHYDNCIVNITYEATEIGIVRDGTLHYASHIPFGSFSLAREIATVTSVPLYEAFKYLHEEPYAFMENLPQAQKDEIEQIFEAYTERVANLFHETGDELSIPKQILLHGNLQTEPLFQDIITKAAKRRLKSEPTVRLITAELINKFEIDPLKESLPDTAMLASAQFFHKQNHCTSFEYT
jgi:cell division ATPase FtsA